MLSPLENAQTELTPTEYLNHIGEMIKWCYNLFILHLLILTLHVSKHISEEQHPDILKDYRVLEKELTILLDSTIRVKLRKQGVTVQQNIYCGYDSEYKNIDSLHNKLLSIQLALSTQTVLKLPLHTEYVFGSINAQTSEFTPSNPSTVKGINLDLVLELTRESIKTYRDIKYPDQDRSLLALVSLLVDSGKTHIKDKDSIAFIFPNTPIKQYFNRTHDSQYSMTDLVTTSKSIVSEDLENSEKEIFSLLKSLYTQSLTDDTGSDDTLGLQKELTSPGNISGLPSILDLDRTSVEELPVAKGLIRKRRT